MQQFGRGWGDCGLQENHEEDEKLMSATPPPIYTPGSLYPGQEKTMDQNHVF